MLSDVISSGIVPTISLDTVFRQAEESMIVVNAHKINLGEYPILNKKDKDFFFVEAEDTYKTAQLLTDLVCRRLPNAYGLDPMADIQVISPMKKTQTGVYALNAALQALLNPGEPGKNERAFQNRILREGDKVMQIKNNYDLLWKRTGGDEGSGVYNGDMGRIVEVKTASVTILFDDGKKWYMKMHCWTKLNWPMPSPYIKARGASLKPWSFLFFSAQKSFFPKSFIHRRNPRQGNGGFGGAKGGLKKNGGQRL